MRITKASQLEGMSEFVRRQLAGHVDDAERRTEELEQASFDPRNKTGRHVNRPEQDAGRRLVRWIDALVLEDGTRPGLYFAHVPNGGARSAKEAAIFAGQGVRPGWPDYVLDLPRGGYHGLRLELKAPDAGKPGLEQLEILARLEAVGYRVCIAWGYEEARAHVRAYLDLDR